MHKRGVVGFATNWHSQVSAIIRWFTQSNWSHSFIITDVIKDRTYLLEANYGGTDVRSWREYRDPTVVPTELWLPNASEEAIDSALAKTQAKFEGVTYGYLELLWIGVKISLAKAGWRVHDPVQQGAICSQVAWFYLHELFPQEFGHLDGRSVTPADLHRVVLNSPSFTKV